MNRFKLAVAAAPLALLAACGSKATDPNQYGGNPQLPEQQHALVPSMKIADPTAWGGKRPIVPAGYTVTAIATGLGIPRQALVLPNGDILVSEGRGGSEAALRPKDIIAGYIKAKGTTSVKKGNRLTLLRDADGDGIYELRTVFAGGLNAPYGLALVNGRLYVANQDSLVMFTYRDGQTRSDGLPVKVTDLPSEINHHWTKSLAASPDGRFLYVGIGSNSNITERGMTWFPTTSPRCEREHSMAGPTATGATTSIRGYARKTRPRSPRPFAPTMAWDRTWRHWASHSRRPRWGRSSPTGCSWASMAAGTATTRRATRWCSCRSAADARPEHRSTS
jgi:glucose/arabinose dehydrogenase